MKNLFTLLIVTFSFSLALGQGVTSSSINGQVTDDKGEGLIGANVVALHVPSGTSYGNISDDAGYFRIPNMRPGGPYKITVSYTGFEDNIKDIGGVALGQSLKLDFELSEVAVNLSEIAVIASRNDIFDGNITGAQTVVDEQQIATLPTVARAIGDFARMTPQATINEGSDGFTISLNGMNNRYNSIYIDGAVNNDVFGLAGSGTNGGQTGVSPFSIDAIESFQISLAPFDVRQGGFAGGSINAITRSGDNNLEGSVYYFYRNENTAGETPTDNPDVERRKLDEFNARTFGFRLGGPIMKDKLFFFVNAELQRDETPLPFDFINYEGDSDQADLGGLVNKLNGYGYDPGGYLNNSSFLDSDKITVKFDWNANDKNKLSLKHSYVGAQNRERFQSSTRSIRFQNGAEFFDSKTNNTSLEWNALIGNTMSNNLKIGYTKVDDDRDPSGDPFPYVEINDGSASIFFGSERFSTANLLEQDIFTLTNNFEIFKGKHFITIGTHNEFYSAKNLFIAFNYGQYEFGSLEEFLTDQPADFFQRSYSLRDNISGDESAAAAEFTSAQYGVYIQDEIQVNDNFKLTAGLRADIPTFEDTPVNEDFNQNTIQLLEDQGYDLRGAETGKFIKSQVYLSPRLGFNWDLTGQQKTQLRGGIGIFTSRVPQVWPGGAFNNFGLNIGYTRSFDNTFNPDIQSQLPGDIDPNNVEPSGSIDLFAEDFKIPQVWKANLSLDQKLAWGLILNLDGIFNKTINNVAYQNLNLRPSVQNLSGTPDTRPLYDRGDEIDPTYSRILLGYNTDKGYTYNFTVTLTKPLDDKGLYGMFAYSYGDSYSIFDGTSSQNSSQWRGLHSIGGRNFDQPVSRSDFSQGSRFILSLSKKFFWNEGKNLATTISLFHESRQGSPYSYIYNDNGNLNNEDSRERNLIYVPRDASEIVLVDDSGAGTAAEQWAALDAFIDSDDYLSGRRGQYAERNESRAPWSHVMDLKVLQDFTLQLGEKTHTFQVSFDIFNFTNLLNRDWGRRYFVPENFQLLNFEGMMADPTTGEETVPTFTFDGVTDNDPSANNIIDNGFQSSRYQVQIGLRYIFK